MQAQQLVRLLGEIAFTEPGDLPTACESIDVDKVITCQLTENTGKHYLDSGSFLGRHWEKNQENPPWEEPEFEVYESWVTKNVYHHMSQILDRDTECVAIEAVLYAYSYNGPGKEDKWRKCMEGFASASRQAHPDDFIDLGMDLELARLAHDALNTIPREEPYYSMNTYNSEFGSLSQILQFVQLGGPYGEIAFVQVHNGSDIRGGYTAPRVYRVTEQPLDPSEFFYICSCCDNQESEGMAYSKGEWLDFRPDDNEIRCNDCGGVVNVF